MVHSCNNFSTSIIEHLILLLALNTAYFENKCFNKFTEKGRICENVQNLISFGAWFTSTTNRHRTGFRLEQWPNGDQCQAADALTSRLTLDRNRKWFSHRAWVDARRRPLVEVSRSCLATASFPSDRSLAWLKKIKKNSVKNHLRHCF